MKAHEAPCPACTSTKGDRRGDIKFCRDCGHRWLLTSPETHKLVEEHTYTLDYNGYRPDERFAAFAAKFTQDHLIPRVAPPARLLDVGCGAGAFMEVARDAGYDVQGIDISQASAQLCQARGLRAIAGDFLVEDFDGGRFDVITMWDVVEHLRDPESFFRRAKSLLSDRGLLFAKIPGFGDLSVRISARFPAAGGALLGAPGHVQYFDQQSLSTLLKRVELQPSWVDGGRARSAGTGGTMKRKLARQLREGLKFTSGDKNLYVLATAGDRG